MVPPRRLAGALGLCINATLHLELCQSTLCQSETESCRVVQGALRARGPWISRTLRVHERDPPSRRPGGTARSVEDRAQPALQPRSRAGSAPSAHVVHLQLCGAVDQHGALHPDLHAGLGVDGERHELVAGAHHHPPRQHHRPDSDPAQLASGHEVRHSVSRSSRVRRMARSVRIFLR